LRVTSSLHFLKCDGIVLFLFFQKKQTRRRLRHNQCHCGESFKTAAECAEHREIHEEGWQCGQCEAILKTAKSYCAHLRTHKVGRDRWRHLCTAKDCNFGTNEPKALAAHMAKKHNQDSAPGFKCPHCGKMFHSERYWRHFHKTMGGCVKHDGVEQAQNPPKGFKP
jgi:uncharacterized C2H2 Zn-finger protein